MGNTVQIYIHLPEEAVAVWRPVEALHLYGNTYRIIKQAYDREDEFWEFEPGDTVICKMVESCDGPILGAVMKAEPSQ